MAMADYYLCDVCGCKTFYDSDVDYGDRVGEMAVICSECAKTHKIHVRALEQSEGWVSVSELVKAAQRVSDWEHLTMETFDKTYPELANLPLTEKADAVWQPLLTTLAAYKSALPSPPSAAEGEVKNG